MAYFSNGTEGEMYQEHYCFRCEHWPDDEYTNCPIWAAHQFYNYDGNKIPQVKDILNLLIPEKDHTFKDGLTMKVAAECSFFRHRTEKLPFDEAQS